MAFSPASDGFAVSSGQRLAVFDLPSLTPRYTVELAARISAIAFEHGRVVVGERDGAIEVVEAGASRGRMVTNGGAIDSIAIDTKTRRAATTSADGLVRIFGLDGPRLLAALAEYEDDEWLVTTPGGAYVGSPEVGERMSWVFSDPLESYGYEQFEEPFRKPEIVARRLRGEDVDVTNSFERPPVVRLAAEPPAQTSASSIKLTALLESSTRVDSVRAIVEGRVVAEAMICAASGHVDIEVPLLPGENRVTLIAFDQAGRTSIPVAMDVSRTSGNERPDLWIVAVGVDRYPHLPASMGLEAAANDARAITEALTRLGAGEFANVHARTLIDFDATPDSVRSAMRELSAMRPNDLAVVFFSGHGFQRPDNKETVLATSLVELTPDGQTLALDTAGKTTIGWADIAAALEAAHGRVLVLLDACHAGRVGQGLVVPNEQLAARLQREGRAGVVVFAASKGRQYSYEPGRDRGIKRVRLDGRPLLAPAGGEPHGLFTAAVLAALGDATTDLDGDGRVQFSELSASVRERVTLASDSAQTPFIARRMLFGDFDVSAKAQQPAPDTTPATGGRCGCRVDDARCNEDCAGGERAVSQATAKAARTAAACKKTPGIIVAEATLDVDPKGALSRLQLSGAIAGTPFEACVKKILSTAVIPPFFGPAYSVHARILVGRVDD